MYRENIFNGENILVAVVVISTAIGSTRLVNSVRIFAGKIKGVLLFCSFLGPLSLETPLSIIIVYRIWKRLQYFFYHRHYYYHHAYTSAINKITWFRAHVHVGISSNTREKKQFVYYYWQNKYNSVCTYPLATVVTTQDIGCTFASTVGEEIIAERRDLHIWTQLILRILSMCIFTHKIYFFLKHRFFVLHFRRDKFRVFQKYVA